MCVVIQAPRWHSSLVVITISEFDANDWIAHVTHPHTVSRVQCASRHYVSEIALDPQHLPISISVNNFCEVVQ
jgi:hypothetical protein